MSEPLSIQELHNLINNTYESASAPREPYVLDLRHAQGYFPESQRNSFEDLARKVFPQAVIIAREKPSGEI